MPGRRPYPGFTLLELSIVLAVIGLIVGGILVGRDLIHSSEIRSTVGQYQQFNTAVHTFRNKYNCLPGDCINANVLGFIASSSGNQDGTIGGLIAGCSTSLACILGRVIANRKEYINFWYHLGAASLIPFPGKADSTLTSWTVGVVTPPAKIKAYRSDLPSGWALQADAWFYYTTPAAIITIPHHNFMMSSNARDFLTAATQGTYHPADAYDIDVKIDNGRPLNGKVVAWDSTSSFYYRLASSGNCVRGLASPATAEYHVRYSGAAATDLCGLFLKALF